MGKALIKKGLRRCYVCKRILPLTHEYFGYDKKNGANHERFKYICRECIKKKRKEYYLKNKEKIKKYRLENIEKIRKRRKELYYTPKGRYREIKNDAKRRGIEWNLTFEQFMQFWQKPCYYCGVEIKTIGLDRIDSGKGYTIDNIVSCCHYCNTLKNNMSQKEFIDKCKKIAQNKRIQKMLKIAERFS